MTHRKNFNKSGASGGGEKLSLHNIGLLTRVQACNLFGNNEFKYTRDKKRRQHWIAMAAVIVLLILIMITYIGGMCCGFVSIGMGELIPEYLFTIVAIMIFFFNVIKAGSVIFQNKGLDMLVSLPVSTADIVISRFLTMYASNLIISVLVMLPGIAIYGIWAKPDVSAYIFALGGTILLPTLPIAAATAIGAAITAISSRTRRKSLFSIVLMLAVIVAMPAAFTALGQSAESMTTEMLQDFVGAITTQMERLYYPTSWFGGAVIHGSALDFLWLAVTSAAAFGITVFIVQRYFKSICSALNSTSAKNNYTIEQLKSSSVTGAMLRRESKRYFSSSVYATNTLAGHIMAIAASVALAIIGLEKLMAMLELNLDGAGFDPSALIVRLLPFILSAMIVLMPTTAASISMEGKQWWILQTLPVKSRDVWNGKILLNLTLAVPSYVISVICCVIAIKPTLREFVWIALIPAVYIIFTSVAGIALNLAFPLMNWENEARVAKQSASSTLAMLVSLVSVGIPIILLFAGIAGSLPYDFIAAAWLGFLALVTLMLYVRISKTPLSKIS